MRCTEIWVLICYKQKTEEEKRLTLSFDLCRFSSSSVCYINTVALGLVRSKTRMSCVDTHNCFVFTLTMLPVSLSLYQPIDLCWCHGCLSAKSVSIKREKTLWQTCFAYQFGCFSSSGQGWGPMIMKTCNNNHSVEVCTSVIQCNFQI